MKTIANSAAAGKASQVPKPVTATTATVLRFTPKSAAPSMRPASIEVVLRAVAADLHLRGILAHGADLEAVARRLKLVRTCREVRR
jgi:hypothetical protein